MRFEVLSCEDMNEFFRKFSRVGIMNRLVEEMKLEIEYYLIVRGKYLKFVEFSFKVFIFGEEFEVI